MGPVRLTKLLDTYDEFLQLAGYEPSSYEPDTEACVDTELDYAYYLVHKARGLAYSGRTEDAMYTVGVIHGIFLTSGMFTLEQVTVDMKPSFGEEVVDGLTDFSRKAQLARSTEAAEAGKMRREEKTALKEST